MTPSPGQGFRVTCLLYNKMHVLAPYRIGMFSLYHHSAQPGCISVLVDTSRHVDFQRSLLQKEFTTSNSLNQLAAWNIVRRNIHCSTCHLQKVKPKEESKEIMESRESAYGKLTTGQKVAQAGKDASYTAIVIGGVLVTGVMFYAIGRELFSGQSPSGIYGKALKKCRKNDELSAAIGEPIKGYGEMTRRGRRRHVSHNEYEKDGVKYMRMKFYVEGPYGKGTAHLEVKEDDSGKYQFRYLFVEMNDIPPRTFIIEDQR